MSAKEMLKNKENLKYYTDEVVYLFMKACIERKKLINIKEVVFC